MAVANQERTPSAALAWALAITAWVSQVPYFFWTLRQPALMVCAAGVGAIAAAAFWLRRHEPLARHDVLAVAGLATFVIYITAQKTVAAGHALWIFVLPTLFAIAIARPEERRHAYRAFELIFVLSLIPGLIALLLLMAGVPLTFGARPPPNVLFANAGERMLEAWGAVFIESNSQLLPWGGVISRLCGMFDEPGMVGTIAAMMLAVRGFQIRGWRAVLLWVSGALSLSLAFFVLTLMGLGARTLLRREWRSAVLAVPVAAAAMFTVGIGRPAVPAGVSAIAQVRDLDGHLRSVLKPTPIVTKAPPAPLSASGVGGLPPPPVHAPPPLPPHTGRVRQTDMLNNRSLPEMNLLVERYWASDWRTIAFGFASDASVVYGGASAVWTRVLTNHGVFGLGLLALAFGGAAVAALRRTDQRLTMLLFLVCFGLSFYQRPVIWLPYTLLVFFGGLALLERDETATPE